ncbi:MAG: phosphoserine phosphatase SerB [Kiloniellales bacterium]|nr:phosphoserine phosphatase SerB [Kiloniellales bacterium]
MDHVVTLIAAPGDLEQALVDRVAAALGASGAACGSADWLAEAEACDLPIAGLAPSHARRTVRGALEGAPADFGVVARENRRKRLLVADMESTIIAEEMLDELAARLGIADQVAPITARAMNGELDFAEALQARVGLLTGQPASLLEEMAAGVTLNPGARALVQTLRAQGALTALVSGGFTCFTEPVGAACGFDRQQANRLVIEDGRLTGEVAAPILDRAAKRAALEALAAEQGLDLAASCAVGDGANDVDLLQAAGLGVGYRPKAALRRAADVSLDHGDLTALLYLQGYRKAEFKS